jgi:hypothetical protein
VGLHGILSARRPPSTEQTPRVRMAHLIATRLWINASHEFPGKMGEPGTRDGQTPLECWSMAVVLEASLLCWIQWGGGCYGLFTLLEARHTRTHPHACGDDRFSSCLVWFPLRFISSLPSVCVPGGLVRCSLYIHPSATLNSVRSLQFPSRTSIAYDPLGS